jgi:hypothetical protein
VTMKHRLSKVRFLFSASNSLKLCSWVKSQSLLDLSGESVLFCTVSRKSNWGEAPNISIITIIKTLKLREILPDF